MNENISLLKSFLLEELNEFEWKTAVKISSLENPFSALFEF